LRSLEIVAGICGPAPFTHILKAANAFIFVAPMIPEVAPKV